jgi:BTG family protein
MRSEVSTAAQWWADALRNVDVSAKFAFAQCLTNILVDRFAAHWYVDNPVKGSAYRSIMYDPDYSVIDDALLVAGEHAGINHLPTILASSVESGVRMWIDPDEVTVENVKGKPKRQTIYQGGRSSPPPAQPVQYSSRGLYTVNDYVNDKMKESRMKASINAHFVPSGFNPALRQLPNGFVQYQQPSYQPRAGQLAY